MSIPEYGWSLPYPENKNNKKNLYGKIEGSLKKSCSAVWVRFEGNIWPKLLRIGYFSHPIT